MKEFDNCGMKELNWGGSKLPLIFQKGIKVYKSHVVFVVNNNNQ